MEVVSRGVLGGAYAGEPRRCREDIGELMDVAPVGTHGRQQWEPPSSWGLAFMVSMAADAAVWQDLKDMRSPMYHGNPLNVDRFLENLNDWGTVVTENMDPAQTKKHFFKRFRWCLSEVLQELYFVAAKGGKIRNPKNANKCLNEQEWLDAPQVAAKRWRAIKLQHDGKDIRLREWRDFRAQYVLLSRNVEERNEDDEQSRLLNLLPDASVKQVTKKEAKRARSKHTVKMMLNKDQYKKVVNCKKANVARDFQMQSLQNALVIIVSRDRQKAAVWCLDDCEVRGGTIHLQAIPARMSCNDVVDLVAEEVLKEYKNLDHNRGMQGGERSVHYVGEGSGGEAAMDPAEAEVCEGLDDADNEKEPTDTAVCAFVAHNLHNGGNRGS